MTDPRPVWRYMAEFLVKDSTQTDTLTGRCRAMNKPQVEEYVEMRVDKEWPGAKIIKLDVYPASGMEEEQTKTNHGSVVVPFVRPQGPPALPAPKKEEDSPVKYYKDYPVTPGLGISGFADKDSEFYATVPHER